MEARSGHFLLVPRIPNLASKVLSLVLARLPEDWGERFGYRPVLVESFVESRRFRGSCYRAANWIHVGSTSGRGRQDSTHRADRGRKEVFLFPLEEEWREKLCVEPILESKTTSDWTHLEFGDADLGDERLTKRLCRVARDFFAHPTANIPEACGGRAETKAAYRLFANEHVTMDSILATHVESTVRRVAKEKIVLAIQDTTSLSYTTHLETEGLGPIAGSPITTLGLLVHSTLAVNTAGTPLGLLDVQCWARDLGEHGKRRDRNSRSIEDKESLKWLVGYHATEKAQRRLEETRIVNVGDAEADLFELFVRARRGGTTRRPDVLIRAKRPRRVECADRSTPLVLEHMNALPRRGRLPIVVPRSGSRPRRETSLELRFAELRIRPAWGSPHRSPITMTAILATEERQPTAGQPIEWLLLTTIPVRTVEEAAEKVGWYALRWQIEVFHRTLKSGCRIEDRQLGSAKSLEACLAVDMVVAWRIFHLTKLGRELPDVPCSVFFEEMEWKALVCFVEKSEVLPTQPPTLKEATRMVARLGGFIGGSKNDPGTQTMWRGLQRLDDIAVAFDAGMKVAAARMDSS